MEAVSPISGYCHEQMERDPFHSFLDHAQHAAHRKAHKAELDVSDLAYIPILSLLVGESLQV